MNKESIYYYDINKTYRPNKGEINSKSFNCPRCRNLLSRPRYCVLTEIYTCPSCGFKIEIKQILTKEQIPTAIENKKKRRNIEELVVQDIVAKKANAPDKDEQHAELIYQKFWQSDDGRKVYEAARKEFPDNFQEQTDFVMNAITSEFELDHNERNLVQNKVLDGLV